MTVLPKNALSHFLARSRVSPSPTGCGALGLESATASARHWPRIDEDATLDVASRRDTLRVAGSTDSVAVVAARPAALIFGDDTVGVVVADLGRWCRRRRGHTLRHSAAVGWLETGAHIKAVADLLGHSSVAVTGDVYGPTSDDTARAAVDGRMVCEPRCYPRCYPYPPRVQFLRSPPRPNIALSCVNLDRADRI